MTAEELTQLAINTIRTLSIDAVQQAKSGHPGTPMALAAFAADPKGIAGRELLGGSVDLQAAISANGINVVIKNLKAGAVVTIDEPLLGDTHSYADVKVRVAVEQASTFGWERYVGRAGCVVGMKTFGASAPLKEPQRKFGFEPDQAATVAKDLLRRSQRRHASVAA
jgi:transketolase